MLSSAAFVSRVGRVLYMSRRKLDRGLDEGKLTHGDYLCLDSSPAAQELLSDPQIGMSVLL